MENKNRIALIVVVIVLVIGFAVWHDKARMNNNQYSVVYLTTGEVYVGKLSKFPDFELKDSYILQVAKDATDPTKSNFQLNPISEALWAPETLHLIQKNIVFYGEILPTSKIGQTLAQKGK